MPHRLTQLTSSSLWAIDGACLGFATVLAIFDEITMKDLTGPNGFLIASIGVCWVLWKNGQSRDKLLGKNHDEMLVMQRESNDQLAKLTAESIKASFMVSSEMRRLAEQLETRPCQKPLSKP